MQYGHFDNEKREYVIDRVDTPVSWTNYIGQKDLYGVFNQTAGGYVLCGSSEYHRITRFRPNGVPMDGPGHYIYIRDDETGEYWSVSWQPVGRDKAKYACRHGLGYVRYLSDYADIHAEQTLFAAIDDPVEIWDVCLRNDSGRARRLSVYSYAEFSFHQVDMDMTRSAARRSSGKRARPSRTWSRITRKSSPYRTWRTTATSRSGACPSSSTATRTRAFTTF